MSIYKKEAQIKAIKKNIEEGKCKNVFAAKGKLKKLERELILLYKGESFNQFLAQ